MNPFRTVEIKLIGAFFLVAGLFGLWTFLALVFPLDDLTSILNIFPTVLFALALYSGYLLLLKENSTGLQIGRAVIALQMVNVEVAGIGYLFVTAAYMFAGFANLDAGLTVGLENTFWLGISDDASNLVFRINILAVAIFIYLTRVMNKMDKEEEERACLEKEKARTLEQKES